MDTLEPIEEVIRWQQEHALTTGEIGYTQDSGGIQDIFKDWDIETASSLQLWESPGNVFDLIAAAEHVHDIDAAADVRYTENLRMLDQDTFVQEDVRSELHRRLLRAGRTGEEIVETTDNTMSLRKMTSYLHRVENPDLREGVRLKAAVNAKFRGARHPAPIFLSPKDDFQEFLATLKEFVLAKAQSTGRPVTPKEDLTFLDSWIYSRAYHQDGRLKLFNHPWTRLTSKFDYREMMTSIKILEREGSIVILMPAHHMASTTNPKKPTSARRIVKGENDTEEHSVFSSSPSVRRSNGSTDLVGSLADSINGVPAGMDNLLKEYISADWADLARRFEEGEDFFSGD